MNRVTSKSSYISRRFYKTVVQEKSSKWVQPQGFKTDIMIYNFMEKAYVPLVLKNKGLLRWYSCGPTVYDSAHIGHACTYVRFDVIRRILSKFFNINVIFIMGITDIDDKIIKRSFNTKKDWKLIAKHYEQEFVQDTKSLNVAPPYLYCRVTDYIPHIVNFVEKICAQNGAYIGGDGSLYFDTTVFRRYGKLQKVLAGKGSSLKRSSNDFALWKASKPGEPFWESPWGRGRPGWHIECSAMASSIFGNSIDIHSGGNDLLFPHHENEEAQSCCYHDTVQWVNYWLHSGFLHTKGDTKMSKSLQNTIGIKEILEKYSSDEFRMFCLLTHYRNSVEFSDESMHNAVRVLAKLEHFLSDCRNYVSGNLSTERIDERGILDALQLTDGKVHSALATDFDTAKAIQAIQELVILVGKIMKSNQSVECASLSGNTVCIAAVAEYVSSTLSDLGIWGVERQEGNGNQWSAIVDSFVDFRKVVRSRAMKQNVTDEYLLEACDQARDNLAVSGIQIKDHKNTSTWTKVKYSKSIS